MSILSGRRILAEVEAGSIEINPFVPSHLNPASIDLTLGDQIEVFATNATEVAPSDLIPGRGARVWVTRLDAKQKPEMRNLKIPPEGITLSTGHLYLMHTIESVWTKNFVPVLDGKSSLARIGVSVHSTAGYGDPGYRGQYTLEVTTVYPVRLYAGMRICQMRFHELSGEADDYQTKGHYVGDQRGPQPSRVHEQFK